MDGIKVEVKFPRCYVPVAYIFLSLCTLLALILGSLGFVPQVGRLDMMHSVVLVIALTVTSLLAVAMRCFSVASAKDIARLALQVKLENERRLLEETRKSSKEDPDNSSANRGGSPRSLTVDLSIKG